MKASAAAWNSRVVNDAAQSAASSERTDFLIDITDHRESK